MKTILVIAMLIIPAVSLAVSTKYWPDKDKARIKAYNSFKTRLTAQLKMTNEELEKSELVLVVKVFEQNYSAILIAVRRVTEILVANEFMIDDVAVDRMKNLWLLIQNAETELNLINGRVCSSQPCVDRASEALTHIRYLSDQICNSYGAIDEVAAHCRSEI
ncbi:MAG: hypothetical protein KDD25_00165 [Bdellovibrionales bacterium]|nr:hypothetical protein [Bdellovibrionales bacterium]